MLTLKNITHSFGGLTAVNDISVEFQKNSISAVIGPNGAGKTTLFNIISGFISPDNGIISIDGTKINHLKPFNVSKEGISRTFQNINLFKNISVLENVTSGMHNNLKGNLFNSMITTLSQRKEEEACKEKAMSLLKFVGLENKFDLLSMNLSYGEQRRLEIARALANDPLVLLLDEPAAGMNSREKEDLSELLERIRENGVTIILVEHDMGLVMKVAEFIMVMNYGKEIARGNPSEVQQDSAVIEAYLGSD